MPGTGAKGFMYSNTVLLTTLRDKCHILSLNRFTQQGVVESGFNPSPSETKCHTFLIIPHYFLRLKALELCGRTHLYAMTSCGICIMAWTLDEPGGVVKPTYHPSHPAKQAG